MSHDECHDTTIRSVRPADGPAIEAMHARCSPTTLRTRWHGVSRRVPRAYLAEVLAGVPWHVAVVAVRGDEVVGLASARDERGHWEIAVLVEDGAQGNGVGRALLAATVDGVREHGGERLGADVLAGERLPLRLLAQFGPVGVVHQREAVRATVELTAAHRPGSLPVGVVGVAR